jgi:hypothetical protein
MRPEWSVLCGRKDLYLCHADPDGKEICILISPLSSLRPQREELAHAKIAKKIRGKKTG